LSVVGLYLRHLFCKGFLSAKLRISSELSPHIQNLFIAVIPRNLLILQPQAAPQKPGLGLWGWVIRHI
ncbi:MAG: hypothetical protein K2M12_08000, partial [Muribaculaceae bacterium]|nr:hypothetical protein [Muribaculaceae bacterium]